MKEILKNMNIVAISKGKNGVRKLVYTLLGVVLTGVGVSVFAYSDLGVDSFTSFTMSVSDRLGIGFGTLQLIVNFIILIAVAIFSKKLIGIGTVLNMVLVGYTCQFCEFLYGKFLPEPANMPVKLAVMVLGTLIISFGLSLYFASDLGVSPYDATGVIIEEKTKLAYRWCRIITDVIITACAILLCKMKFVGIGTVVTAFCLGPFISFFRKYVAEKLVNKK